MLDPAKPFSARRPRDTAPVATVKADLTGLLDRARDERFRLLKMLKDARTEVAATVEAAASNLPQSEAIPAPATTLALKNQAETHTLDLDSARTLLGRLIELDNKLDAKVERIHQLADDKLALLKAMDARVSRRVAELDQVQAAADQQMHEQLVNHRQRLADLTDAADAELQAQAQRLDTAVAGLTELFEHQAQQLVADLRERAAKALNERDASDTNRRAA